MTEAGSPTEAHQSQLALYHRVLLAVAERRQDDLPGLTESLQDEVLLTTGGTSRPAYGWFAKHAWRYGDRHVHELFLNADRQIPHPSVSASEDVLITLLHEACHVCAQANGIQDSSRQGRYHNRRFAEIARKIGLVAEPHGRIGHITPYLSAWARVEYADLLSALGAGLMLAREPKLTSRRSTARPGDGLQDGDDTVAAPAPSPRYVFASCG